MSVDACVAYYGLRFEVDADDIDGLEHRTDSRITAAGKAGLRHYWGNFGAPGERYLLFVGEQLAVMGSENDLEVEIRTEKLTALIETTRAKLISAGLCGEPALHLRWEASAYA